MHHVKEGLTNRLLPRRWIASAYSPILGIFFTKGHRLGDLRSMFSPQETSRVVCCAFFAASVLSSPAAVLTVLPGVNNAPVTGVTYSIGGVDVVQGIEPPGAVEVGNFAVNIKSVRIEDGGEVELKFFNTEGAMVVNVNPEIQNIGGIGIYNNGTTSTPLDLNAYALALAAVTQDTNLRHYGYHDYLSPAPPTPGVPDYDVWFYRALNPDDYMLISERWGNSFFEVTALMEDGTPYPNANVLRIGGQGGDFGVGYQVHDWITGFAASDNFEYQAKVLTVISAAKFFEGTNSQAMPIYGLRFDNDDEADVKVIGASDNTFLDNPINSLVPEPSSFLMSLVGSLCLLCSRKRTCR
jgi:hypothetical protein